MKKLWTGSLLLLFIFINNILEASEYVDQQTRTAYYQICRSNGHDYFTNVPHQQLFLEIEIGANDSVSPGMCVGTSIDHVHNTYNCTRNGVEYIEQSKSGTGNPIPNRFNIKQKFQCYSSFYNKSSTPAHITAIAEKTSKTVTDCGLTPTHPKKVTVNGQLKCEPEPIPCEIETQQKCSSIPNGSNPIYQAISPELSLSHNAPNPINIGSCSTNTSTTPDEIHDYQSMSIDRDFQLNTEFDTPLVTIHNPHTGKAYSFSDDGAGGFTTEPIHNARLEGTTDGQGNLTGYNLALSNGSVENYNVNGRLSSITQRNGQGITIGYNSNDKPTTITTSFGRVTTLSYDTSGKLSTITGSDNQTTTLEYDTSGRRKKIIFDDDTSGTLTDNPYVEYHYDDTNNSGLITRITDESGTELRNWTYDVDGNVLSEIDSGGTQYFTYNVDDSITITNKLGKDTTYYYTIINGERLITQVEGVASANCAGANQYKSYDRSGALISKTDWTGNTTNFLRDSQGNEVRRIDGFGSTEERVIHTEWHDIHKLPVRVMDDSRQTIFSYDSNGNLLSEATSDADPNYTVPDSASVSPPTDYIAYWPMESISSSTITDQVGSHDASAVGSPSISTSGRVGNALSLSGIGQYATITDDLSLQPTSVTVCAYLKGNANAINDIVFQSYSKTPNISGFKLQAWSNGHIGFLVGDYSGASKNVGYAAISIGKVNDNTWHHVCASYDGSYLRGYYDGVLTSEKPYNSGIKYSLTNFVAIGTLFNTSTQHATFNFNGLIDELKLYGRALSHEEVLAIFLENE